MLRAYGLLAVLAFGACVHDTTVSLSDFDTSCKTDADCVVATTGDVCACTCSNAGINKDSLAAWQAEVSEKEMYCTAAKPPCPSCACPQGGPTAAFCDQGQCKFDGCIP